MSTWSQKNNDQGFHPFVTCIEDVGRVVDTVHKLVQQHQPNLVIVGIYWDTE